MSTRSYGRRRGINSRFELRHFEATREILPESWSYEYDMPPVLDQGAYGTCVAHGTAEAQMFYHKKRTGSAIDISRSAIYSQAKYTYEPTDIADDGLQITDGLLIPKNFGFVPESAYPYPSDSTGQNTGDLLEPVPSDLWNPSFKEASYLSVNMQSLDAIMRAIVAKGVVVIGMSYPSEWENLPSNGYADPAIARTDAGGHCVVIIGYSQSEFGGSFKVRNSWSSYFADKGDFYLPFAALTEASQFWPDEGYVVGYPVLK